MTDVLVSPPRDGVWLADTVRVLAVTVKHLEAHPEAATPGAVAEAQSTVQELCAHLAREHSAASHLRQWAESLARKLASIA
jgi:hypothetical protein